jgi:hypothetical protein
VFIKKKWFLVYTCVKLETMYRAENLLANHEILYKTNVFSRNLTSAMRDSPSGRQLLFRNGREETIYKIYTTKENEEKAKFLLSRI